MARIKLPGVYMIRNKLNNKVYIGESTDIPNRFKRYRWAVNSSANYAEVTRPITMAMRQDGIENFEFRILKSGPEYKDRYLRLQTEIEYIYEYQSYDGRFGYNETKGGESGPITSRTQSTKERTKRSKAVFLYDTETQNTQLYFSGAKGVGVDLGFGKDVMSHTVKRGSLLLDRYYVIPVSYTERHELLEKLRVKKTQNTDQPARAQAHSAKAFARYELAVTYIDLIAYEYYGLSDE
jgi:GIY-YIG catalytic domain protein